MFLVFEAFKIFKKKFKILISSYQHVYYFVLRNYLLSQTLETLFKSIKNYSATNSRMKIRLWKVTISCRCLYSFFKVIYSSVEYPVIISRNDKGYIFFFSNYRNLEVEISILYITPISV